MVTERVVTWPSRLQSTGRISTRPERPSKRDQEGEKNTNGKKELFLFRRDEKNKGEKREDPSR